MASKNVTFVIRPRGHPIKNLPEELTTSSTTNASDFYTLLAQNAHISVHRLRITKGSDGTPIPNSAAITIDQTGLRNQSTIYVKDLGPQIAWRTVFLVEYLGPLLFHPAFYLLLAFSTAPSPLQSLSLLLIITHFLKRELETLFLHRFSATTMPVFNIFRNSAYYWFLAGLNMAFWIYRADSPIAGPSDPYITYPGILLFIIGELGTLQTHLTLRGLRSSGGTERGIPQGLGFGLVTCPNYMFETVAWVGIALVTWSLSTVVFIVVAVTMMGRWAKKKEARYRREFGSRYEKKRYSMMPGIW
ncbi:3-oxo-5a-steroid 4- dehydrogenase [Toensbergia leucococca]|nr:3-oxo-5a-steroid 4- dehydrogenase [Toensbergia leucococca]